MAESADKKIAKPVIFISHASSDAEFAKAVQQEVEKVFANGVKVYCTSSPGAIAVGKDWLDDIEVNLKTADVVIPIVTPTSVERPWLWFELGATWLKTREGHCNIFPLCAKEIDLAGLPAPLNRLQALSLGKAADLKLLFERLINLFGFGQINSFKASNITARVPKYNAVKITAEDANDRKFYNGKYTGYSDEELKDILREDFVAEHKRELDEFPLTRNERNNLFLGMLVHFRQIDLSLDLPPGTTKKYLTDIMHEYNCTPIKEQENIVRYSIVRRRS